MKALVALVAAVVCVASGCGPSGGTSGAAASTTPDPTASGTTQASSPGTVASGTSSSGSGTVGTIPDPQQTTVAPGAPAPTFPPVPPVVPVDPPVVPVPPTPGPSAVAYGLSPVTCPLPFGKTLGFAGIAIFASDRFVDSACNALRSCSSAKNTSTALIYVVNYSITGGVAAIGKGTYALGGPLSLAGGTFATATLARTDDQCVFQAVSATKGSVTIDSIDGVVTGSYTLEYPSGTVSGTFNASNCSETLSLGDICSTYEPPMDSWSCQGNTNTCL